jgi:hypothetical protein
MRDRAAAPTRTPDALIEGRFGARPNLADRVEKLEAATTRQGEQVANLQKLCDELAARVDALEEAPAPPAARSDRPRSNAIALWADEVHGDKQAATVADADVLADLLATVIELRDDQAELREIVANLSKQNSSKPLSRRPPAGWGTLKQAAGLTGYSSERIRQWAVADKKLGRRLGGQWIVKFDRLPTRDAERN